MSALDAILKQYDKNSNPTGSSERKTYDLKNYFNTMLKDGIKTGSKKVRILPNAGKSPFVEMMAHKIKVGSDWKTFACLQHEKQTDCPFCEAREALLATGKDSDKELAKKYGARKMYIIKVIDRNVEEEGVKFWRISHDYRKQGTFDKIAGIIQAVGQDISLADTGRDLIINIARDQNNIPTITGIVQCDPSPLSSDTEKAKLWIADTRTWEDVYSLKNYDYLEIIVKGGTPVWDKIKEKFIDKASVPTEDATYADDGLSSELSIGTPVDKVETSTNNLNTTVKEDESEDLPF